MTALSEHRSAERRRLLVMALSFVTTVASSCDYVAATGNAGVFPAIVGVGVLLVASVAVPVILFENESGSD